VSRGAKRGREADGDISLYEGRSDIHRAILISSCPLSKYSQSGLLNLSGGRDEGDVYHKGTRQRKKKGLSLLGIDEVSG